MGISESLILRAAFIHPASFRPLSMPSSFPHWASTILRKDITSTTRILWRKSEHSKSKHSSYSTCTKSSRGWLGDASFKWPITAEMGILGVLCCVGLCERRALVMRSSEPRGTPDVWYLAKHCTIPGHGIDNWASRPRSAPHTIWLMTSVSLGIATQETG